MSTWDKVYVDGLVGDKCWRHRHGGQNVPPVDSLLWWRCSILQTRVWPNSRSKISCYSSIGTILAGNVGVENASVKPWDVPSATHCFCRGWLHQKCIGHLSRCVRCESCLMKEVGRLSSLYLNHFWTSYKVRVGSRKNPASLVLHF